MRFVGCDGECESCPLRFRCGASNQKTSFLTFFVVSVLVICAGLILAQFV